MNYKGGMESSAKALGMAQELETKRSIPTLWRPWKPGYGYQLQRIAASGIE